MKLTFECKLTMFDYIPDGAVASTKEEIARDLAECIKDELSDSGGVSITDVTLTMEDGDDAEGTIQKERS